MANTHTTVRFNASKVIHAAWGGGAIVPGKPAQAQPICPAGFRDNQRHYAPIAEARTVTCRNCLRVDPSACRGFAEQGRIGDVEEAHAVALVLDELGATTTDDYRRINADLATKATSHAVAAERPRRRGVSAVVEAREGAVGHRALPAGWVKLEAGRYLHAGTGTEVVKAYGSWWIRIPQRPGPKCPPHCVNAPHVRDQATLAAAITVAEEQVVPRTQRIIEQARVNALFELAGGRPEDWPVEQVDEQTLAARARAAVLAGVSGRHARPNQLVRHIELGTPGIFSHSDAPGCAYVRFAGDAEPSLVDVGDVVVLAGFGGGHWLPCEILTDPAHDDHSQAVTPECLMPESDTDLVGPNLRQVQPGRYESDDRICVTRHPDGTWRVYAETWIENELICSGQPRLSATYRYINRWRADQARQIERDHATADAADPGHRALQAAAAAYKQAHDQHYSRHGRGGWDTVEHRVLWEAETALARAKHALAIAYGDVGVGARFVVCGVSCDDGDTWRIGWYGTAKPRDGETASAQALRYAAEHSMTGPGASRDAQPYRVQVWADPLTDEPDGEWTNLTPSPCAPDQHEIDQYWIRQGDRRSDGSVIESAACGSCCRRVRRVQPFGAAGTEPSAWVRLAEPLPAVEPGLRCLPLALVTPDHYGMEINDGLGTWRKLVKVTSVGASAVNRYVVVATDDLTGLPMPANTLVQLRTPPPLESGPVMHDGVATNRHGAPLRALAGTLHYDTSVDEACEQQPWQPVGVWVLAGLAEDSALAEEDVTGAQEWAAAVLAAAGHGTIVGWDHHRDRYGDMWLPRTGGDDGGLGPGPDASLDSDTQTRTGVGTAPALRGTADATGSPDPGPGPGPVAFTYSVEVRTTAGAWEEVRTDHTPAIYIPTQRVATAVAETVLSNAGPVLGLGWRDRLPDVRVRTRHAALGLVGLAAHQAT